MKTLLTACLVAVSLSATNAWAAEQLSAQQMDQITAGALPSCGGASMCSINLASSGTMTNMVTNNNGVIVTTTTGTGSCTAAACIVQGTGAMPTASGSTTTTGNGVIGTGSGTGTGTGSGTGTGTGSGAGAGTGTGTEPNTIVMGPSLSSFVSIQNPSVPPPIFGIP